MRSRPPLPSRPASRRPPADQAEPATTPRGRHPRRRAAGTTHQPDSGSRDRARDSPPSASPPPACHAVSEILLGRGVAGRDREPEHVTQRPGIPRGNLLAQGQQPRGQHHLGADHPAQRRQLALVVGGGPSLEDEPVDVLPGKAHPNSRPRHGKVGHRRRHEVLEGAVQVRQPDIDEDESDRVDLGGLRAPQAAPWRRPRGEATARTSESCSPVRSVASFCMAKVYPIAPTRLPDARRVATVSRRRQPAAARCGRCAPR